MSRTSARTVPDLTPYPTIRGKKGAFDWYRNILGVEVKYNEIHRKATSGELPSFMISGALWFATQDLYDHLMSKRRTAVSA